VGALTFVPISRRDATRLAGSSLFYPLIGLALGLVCLVVDSLAGKLLSGLPRAMLVLLTWLVLTGAGQARAWARICTALAAGRNRERTLAIVTGDGRVGVAGMAAALATFLVQLRCLLAIETLRVQALLFAPMLACWSIVVLAHGSRAARADGRQVKYASEVGFREFALTSVFAFGILFSTSAAVGVLVGVSAAATIVGVRLLSHWWVGGVSASLTRAAAEITFTLTLAVFAVVQRGV
jgi:cobalamin synthase